MHDVPGLAAAADELWRTGRCVGPLAGGPGALAARVRDDDNGGGKKSSSSSSSGTVRDAAVRTMPSR